LEECEKRDRHFQNQLDVNMPLYRVLLVRQVGRGLPKQGIAYVLLATDAEAAFAKVHQRDQSADYIGALIEEHEPDAILQAGWTAYSDHELGQEQRKHVWKPLG
jgi:hypothetical protein